MLAVAYLVPIAIWAYGGLTAWILLPILTVPLAAQLEKTVSTRSDGPSLNAALAHTGRLLARVLVTAVDRGAGVVRRSLARLSIPLREPFVTSGGVVAERELVLLRLEDDDGAVGYGEAAPLTPYDGVTIEEVVDALRHGNGGPPQARAAEEMARLDLEAHRAGRAIGEPGADAIPVNRTLAGGPPGGGGRARGPGHSRGLLVLQGEGRAA